jgi:hypothetical protein
MINHNLKGEQKTPLGACPRKVCYLERGKSMRELESFTEPDSSAAR